MVKKLRKKFVITAMLSLLVILVVMIGIINAANIHRMFQDADNLLSMLADNDGFFPDMRRLNPAPAGDRFAPDNPFSFDRLNDAKRVEMPYQSRYFFVRFDAEGNITETNLMHIAAITETNASDYANSVYLQGS